MEPEIKDMKYLLSGTLKTLKAQTESNDTPKIPQRLKGSDPEELVDFLMQAYRAIVERRGMEYKDITDAEAIATYLIGICRANALTCSSHLIFTFGSLISAVEDAMSRHNQMSLL
jgi:hypothetical protein